MSKHAARCRLQRHEDFGCFSRLAGAGMGGVRRMPRRSRRACQLQHLPSVPGGHLEQQRLGRLHKLRCGQLEQPEGRYSGEQLHRLSSGSLE